MANKQFQARHGVDVLGTDASNANLASGKGILKLGGTILGSQPAGSAVAYIPIGSSDGSNTYAVWGTLEAWDTSIVIEHDTDNRIRIKSTGNFTTASGTDLTLSGDLAVNGGDFTSSAASFNLLTANQNINIGTTQAASNVINIGTASNSLIYLKSQNVEITSGKLILPASTAAAPEIVVSGATTTGLYITTTSVGLSIGGVSKLSVSSSGATLGTVVSGTWNGTLIDGQYGGTGVNNSGKTITLGGNLTTSGAFATTLTVTGTTNVTLPTSGTLATTGQTFYIGSTAIAINQGTGTLTLPNSALTNSSVTIGSTAIALGASSTTLAGLTSVTSTSFVGTNFKQSVDNASVTVSGGSTAGASIALYGNTHATLANQSVASADNHVFKNASGSTTLMTIDSSGNLVVQGDLTVQGNTVTVNTSTVSVEDAVIQLANGNSTASAAYIGIQAERGATDAYFVWDESIDTWRATTSADGSTHDDAPIKASTVTAAIFVGTLSGNAATASKSSNIIGGNNTTLLGAIHYQSNTDVTTLLAPNTTATKKFLVQTGTGTNGAAPLWDTLINSDIPTALTGKTYNGLTLTASATGFTVAGGTSSKTLTVSNTVTLSGTDGSTIAFGAGGTVLYSSDTGTSGTKIPYLSGANTWGGAQTFAGISHTGLTLTTGTNVDQVYTSGTISLDGTSWVDVVSGTTLVTGSYYVQVVVTGTSNEYYTGVISYQSSNGTESSSEEIPLHRASVSSTGNPVFMQYLRQNGAVPKIQISSSGANTSSVTVKFRRII